MLRILWTMEGSKRSPKSWVFQDLSPSINKSATRKARRSSKLTFDWGLKVGKEGIHGESQISTFSPLEMERQAPFITIGLFFNSPFQIQKNKGLEKKHSRKMYHYWDIYS
jgi:hypothetical protein